MACRARARAKLKPRCPRAEEGESDPQEQDARPDSTLVLYTTTRHNLKSEVLNLHVIDPTVPSYYRPTPMVLVPSYLD
jgi:hypothetical protein